MSRTVAGEALDFAAHAGAALLIETAALAFGVRWTLLGAVVVAWSLGLVREATEWQDGGNPPWTRWGLLDQAGWIFGGLVFGLVAG